MLLVSTNT